METYEVLERALAEIQHRGWCGQRERHTGEVCAVGALELAVFGEVDQTEHLRAYDLSVQLGLGEVAAARVGETAVHRHTVADFNDSHTRAEVEDLFREAIRAEKAKAGISLDVPEPQREKASV